MDTTIPRETFDPVGNEKSSLFVTKVLISLNVAVFAIQMALGVSPTNPTSVDLVTFGADLGYLVLVHGEWWRLVSSMFVHVGVIHLAINMYSLWQVGSFTEQLFGRIPLTALYFLAGVAGSSASVGWNPMTVSAGASGAIFGLFGAILGFAIRGRSRLRPEVFRAIRTSIVMTLGYNLIFALSNPFLDHAAHLGGFVIGTLGGFLLTGNFVALRPSRPRLLTLAPCLVAVLLVLTWAHRAGLSNEQLRDARERSQSSPGLTP